MKLSLGCFLVIEYLELLAYFEMESKLGLYCVAIKVQCCWVGSE
jgi:bacteriorhodopsin